MDRRIFILIIVVILILGIGALTYLNTSNDDKKNTEEEDSTESEDQTQTSDSEDQTKETENKYIDIEANDAYDLITDNPAMVIIDVSPNYDEGHLPGAINYYVGDGSLDNAIPNLDKEKTYLVYCHVDSASISGAEKLIEAGFKNVYRLKGNYSAWVEADLPTEK